MKERGREDTHTPKQNKNQEYSDELQIVCSQRLQFLLSGPFQTEFANPGFGRVFFDMTPKAQYIKEKH